MALAFGDAADVGELQANWLAADFGIFSGLEVRTRAELNGAQGAYAESLDTIYLSQDLLATGNIDPITGVLLEEAGHRVDVLLNTVDSVGDEGNIFARLVQGATLSQVELASLKGEDDTALWNLEGQLIAVEQAIGDITYAVTAGQPSVLEGNSGVTTITFKITRTIEGGNYSSAGSVRASIEGTTDQFSDFNNIVRNGNSSGTNLEPNISFSSGQTEVELAIDVIGDQSFELDETLTIKLFDGRDLSGNNANVTLSTPTTTTILNDGDVLPNFSLTSLDANGENGFALGQLFGSSDFVANLAWRTSGAGDLNNDGLNDIVFTPSDFVSLPSDTTMAAYVVYGRSDFGDIAQADNPPFEVASYELNAVVDIDELIRNGEGVKYFFKVDGINQRPTSVRDAGDINGDGVDDLILGYSRTGLGSFGKVLLIGGDDPNDNADSPFLFDITAAYDNDRLGESVSGAGDVNGDGINDVLVGAPSWDLRDANGDIVKGSAGATYLILGRNDFSTPLDLSTLEDNDPTNDAEGVVIVKGGAQSFSSGRSVSFVGDVNNDGLDDFAIGSEGRAHVIFGSNTLPSSLDLDNLGSNGFTITPDTTALIAKFGATVSGINDFNGDEIADFALLGGGTNIHIVYGRDSTQGDAFSQTLQIATSNPQSSPADLAAELVNGEVKARGFTVQGLNVSQANFPRGINAAGDLNGDGLADLITGSQSGNRATAYAIFGNGEIPNLGEVGFLDGADTVAGAALTNLNGANGFEFRSGGSISEVSGLGDVNGDGIDDVAIGFRTASSNRGVAQVIVGNIAPEIDLNGSAQGGDFETSFTVGGGPATVVSNSLVVRDFGLASDDTKQALDATTATLAAATVVIENILNPGAEILAADTAGTNITASYNADTGVLSLSGKDTIANYEQILRTVTYDNTATTPDASSARTLRFIVDDGLGHSNTNGVVKSNVSINNSATIGGDINGSGDEDNSITGTLTATDADGLTDSSIFSIDPANQATNGNASIDPATGEWTYIPNSNFNGPDAFTVTVTDDLGGTTTQLINLTVNAVNDPATIGGDTTGSGNEDTEITGTLTATDVDGLTDGTIFSIEAANQASNGTASIDPETGDWTYTPNTNFNGSDAFTVTVTDDLGGTTTQLISLTVNAVNDPATISGDTTGSGNEDTEITGTLTATDVDGLTDGTIFSIEAANQASNGTASIDPATGDWSYTPNSDFSGADAFTVTVTDDLGETTTQIIDLTVNGVDDPATIGGDTTGSGNEDDAEITGTLTATDVDGLTDGSIFSIETGNEPANGIASIDPETGDWTYTPNTNFNGSDAFTVTVTDDLGGTTTQLISLTVNAVNDPATIGGDTTGSGNEDTEITGTLTATDVDGLTDGTIFSIEAANQASNGTASIDPATGDWSYTPNSDFSGADAFTVTVTDDLGETTTQIIDLTVNGVDDPATIGGDTTGSGNEDDAEITGTLTATDVDGLTDGSIFSIETGNEPANGIASIDPETGDWTYTPNTNFNGSDAFTVTVTDNLGGTTTQLISLTVNAVNDPATIGGDTTGSGNEDTEITGILTATDVDGLTDGTIFSIETGPTNGIASIDPVTGAWTYKPSSGFNGPDAFTVTVTDDLGGTTTQVIDLTVNPINVAEDLGTLGRRPIRARGKVNSDDQIDRYQFTLDTDTNKFRASLFSFSSLFKPTNVDLVLLDSTGQEIASSTRPGGRSEFLWNLSLTAGDYSIEVRYVDGKKTSTYSLWLSQR